MKKQQWMGSGLLLLTALIWGCAFVAQSVAMDTMGPFGFGFLRYLLGGIVLLPLIAQRSYVRRRAGTPSPFSSRDRLLGGVICGTLLFAASALQQVGLMYTTPGKSGFLTALYVVLVPLASRLIFRRPLSPLLYISAAAAVAGLYLLCMDGSSLSLNRGDGYTLLCAALFAAQIMAVDRYVTRVDGVQLACMQFLVAALWNAVFMLLTREPGFSLTAISDSLIPLLYTGIMSSGVGYTLQIIGQKHTPPTVATLLMSLESVFSVLAGVVILHQSIGLREGIGCVIMFAAILLAQIPLPAKKPKNE